MMFTVSVAAGAEAADSLDVLCRSSVGNGEVSLIRHRDMAVAWAVKCEWIDTSDDGSVLVVLDGRVHNLHSSPDGQAALIWDRYRTCGVEVAKDLLGDFVVVILDRRTSTLLVARDPVGVRPWYQANNGRRHAGSSAVAPLVALSWVDTTVNEQVAVEYLAGAEASRGPTLHRGIETLRPGETWHSNRAGARTFQHHRWSLEPEMDISWEDAAERCRAVFDEAVQCRMDLAPRPASELSGGLDSSAVVGSAVLLGRRDLKVGRLIFDSPGADERLYSDAVIDHWKLQSASAPPWIPTEEEFGDLARRFHRPPPAPHFTMFVGLYRMLLADGRPDCLTGLGGDDAFVASRMGPRVVSAFKLRQGGVLKGLTRQCIRKPRQSWSEVVRPTLGYVTAPWRRGHVPTWVTRRTADRAELSEVSRRRAEPVTGIDAIDDRLASLTSGYDASILETAAMIGDWLGRRSSHPFLDPRFVMATYGLDPWWPTRGGHYRALEISAFRDRLPAAVTERRSKAEFSEVFWPQVRGDATLARVRNGPLVDLNWLDLDGFGVLLEGAQRGMAGAAIPLFRCVSLDHWLRNQ